MVFLRSVRRLLVAASVVPISPILNIPEDTILLYGTYGSRFVVEAGKRRRVRWTGQVASMAGTRLEGRQQSDGT
jgi:hypothetical protein